MADANLIISFHGVRAQVAYIFASTAIPHLWAIVSIVLMSRTNRDRHKEQ
jgi:hypothetical protein